MRRPLLLLALFAASGCDDGLREARITGTTRTDAALLEVEDVRIGRVPLLVVDSGGAVIATAPKGRVPVAHLPADRLELHGLPAGWAKVVGHETDGPTILARGAPVESADPESRTLFRWVLGAYAVFMAGSVIALSFLGRSGNERLVPLNLMLLISWLILAGALERMWWWGGLGLLVLMLLAPIAGMASVGAFLFSRLVLVGGTAGLIAILVLHPGERTRVRWRGVDAIELFLRANLRGEVELRGAGGESILRFAPFPGNARIVAFVPPGPDPVALRIHPVTGDPIDVPLKRRPWK